MNEKIISFRKFRHDIGNILQNYEGYIILKKYDDLLKYHYSINKMNKNINDDLDLSLKNQGNPPLYSLLSAKKKEAEKRGIDMNISFSSSASNLKIHPVNLTRIIGILLDNAIEEAEKTELKYINFILSKKENDENKVIISISNPTTKYVDTLIILKDGYTTKKKHEGIGLPSIYNMVSQEDGTRFYIRCDNNVFTASLELPIDNNKDFDPFGMNL